MLPRIGAWVLMAGKPNVVPEYETSELARQENAPLADLSTGNYFSLANPGRE